MRVETRHGWELTPERATRLLGTVAGAVAVVDGDGRIRWSADGADGATEFRSLLHPEDRSGFDQQLRATAGGDRSVGRFRLRTAVGYVPARVELIDLREDAAVDALVVVADAEVADERSRPTVERPRHRHDELTGLLTKESLLDEVRAVLSTHRSGGPTPALLYVDLDEFKPVNDSLGHDAGDEVLQAVAGRLQHTTRHGDVVARVGGDEFALLLPEVVDVDDAVAAATKLIERLAEPVGLGAGRTAIVGASVGVAIAAGAEETAERLLFRADSAMFRAKGAGRGRVEAWDDTVPDLVAVHRIIEQTLPAALAGDSLRLSLHPVHDVRSGEQIGNEASLEWDHPRLGRLSGGDWLPATIADWVRSRVDSLVVSTACRTAAVGLPIWLRVTEHQLRSTRFVSELRAGISGHRLESGQIVVAVPVELLVTAGRVPLDLESLVATGAQLAADDVDGSVLPLRRLMELGFTGLRIRPSLLAPEAERVLAAVRGVTEATGLRIVVDG